MGGFKDEGGRKILQKKKCSKYFQIYENYNPTEPNEQHIKKNRTETKLRHLLTRLSKSNDEEKMLKTARRGKKNIGRKIYKWQYAKIRNCVHQKVMEQHLQNREKRINI